MNIGSWKDPAIKRDILIITACLFGVLLVVAMWQLFWWLGVGLVVLVVLGAVMAYVMFRSPIKSGSSGVEILQMPHRGINVGRITVAGIPGLVFTLGIIWMIWFCVPTYRPVVVVAAIIGVVIGLLLVAWRRRSAGHAMHESLGLLEYNKTDPDQHDKTMQK